MNHIIRTSADIPELDLYVGNREGHLLRYFEPQPGLFIAESKTVIEIALRMGYEPYNVVCTEKMLGDEILTGINDNVPVYVVDYEEASKHFGYVFTGGISCALRRKTPADYRKVIENARRIIVLENVQNPTNLGAIFRSAAALGIDAVILSPACVDPLYRRAIRVSMGNTFLLPWTYIGKKESQWQKEGVQLLQEAGFVTVAMALREDNVLLDDPRLKQPDKLAIIMGNEGYGLSPSTIQACDYVAKIPMKNQVDSLNVSVAAGIAMWELTKA